MRKIGIAMVLLATLSASYAMAQEAPIPEEVRAEGRSLLAECRAHAEAERHAVASECFVRLYAFMRQHSLPRASVSLWNSGLALSRLPGRERDARETLQRFLRESTALAQQEDAADVRDWRSEAVALTAELDARIGEPAEPEAPRETPPAASSAGGISPIGPVMLGFGGLMLAAGGVSGGVVLAQDGELVARCPDGVCPGSARSLADEVARLALTADVLLIAGGVVAAVGVVLTIVLREDAPSLTAACGPTGCGVELAGRF